MFEFAFSALCVILFLTVTLFIYEKINTVKHYKIGSGNIKLAVVCGFGNSKTETVLAKLRRISPSVVLIFENANKPANAEELSAVSNIADTTYVFFVGSTMANGVNTLDNDYKIYENFSIAGFNNKLPDADMLSNFSKLENYNILALYNPPKTFETNAPDLMLTVNRGSWLINLPGIGNLILSCSGIHFSCKQKNKTTCVALADRRKKTEISVIDL